MKWLILFLILLLLFILFINSSKKNKKLVLSSSPRTWENSLQTLKDGNRNYLNSSSSLSDKQEAKLLEKQEPIASILACSDSRAVPEFIFDQDRGGLFVARVAGNILNDEIIGTLQYGLQVLHIPLIIVMGHENCGAVDAAISGDPIPPLINNITDKIPIPDCRNLDKEVCLHEAIHLNVENVVNQLRSSPIFKNTKIIGAYYDFVTGKVTFDE